MVISFQSYKISIYIENARQFWNSVNRKPLSWSVVPKNVSVAFNIPWVVARRWRLLSHRWQTASQIAMGSSPAMFMFITFIRSDYKSLNANLILVLVLLTRGSKQILILTRGSYIMGHLFTVVLTSGYPTHNIFAAIVYAAWDNSKSRQRMTYHGYISGKMGCVQW